MSAFLKPRHFAGSVIRLSSFALCLLFSTTLMAQHRHDPTTPPIPDSDTRQESELNQPNTQSGQAQLVQHIPSTPSDPGLAGNGNRVVNQLLLPGGQVFHTTEHTVSSLKTIDVRGSSLQIFTWEERSDKGVLQAYYAVSQSGNKLRGRVMPTSYQVRLLESSFDPLLEGPVPSQDLSADAFNQLFLVQFIMPPLPEFRGAIELYGGKVLRYLPDNTYLIQADDLGDIKNLPYVRWVGDYHPAYRLEPSLRNALDNARQFLPQARYSILLGERSSIAQDEVADLVTSLGGLLDLKEDGGMRVEATLTRNQLLEVVRSNRVQYIDLWGGPGELDMDIVRQVGGADYLESVEGWNGQGVRGEVFDTELLTTHQEWGGAPLIHSSGTSSSSYHGTSCYSINFAQGTDAQARGLIPGGDGIFYRYSESSQFGGTKSRYDINQELIDPAGPYRAVFQTSSVGSSRTTAYTTLSAEVDDYLFLHQILSTQSQSNAGSQNSRPQAWAKNIVSVGGIRHLGTADRSDDYWGSGASIGPAADGRYKPDLAFFYDGIYSARGTGNSTYYQFGGTSAATPETAGHFGLLFQMWHEGVWAGHGGGGDVFESRPQMATAKALMINHAYRYDWNSGGANADIDRDKQGWGTPDIQRLYDRADVTSIIDETDLLQPLQTNSYPVNVLSGESELNITMAYTDLAGTVGAAQARVNDLTLRVVSPSGTAYWGNQGLDSGNFSTAGGSSDTINTVENVFIQNPEAGVWTVEVRGDEIVADSHTETAEIDADYALVISGGLIDDNNDNCAPLPDFSFTFSSANATRGFFFTAPTTFVITGLQVPDEKNHGQQNVEVVRFDSGVTPPAYSANTNAFTSLFRQVGAPSGSVISTFIVVNAGETIGILGAAGDSTIMHNSYGSAPFTSQILGQPVTFTRMGMQYNLASTPAKELWTENSSLARVKMFCASLNEMGIPSFNNTFSNDTRTRGYWFTAPRDFTITGLQVPDETAHGTQHVEVVRFNSGVTPPNWSSTTNAFTSLLRATNVPSNQVVPASITVKAGETIGILGACGDSTMMHNSYGTTYPHGTTILGSSVTLYRLGMQYNLASNAAQSLWTENGRLSRVRLWVAD